MQFYAKMGKTREDVIEEVIENVKFDIDQLEDDSFMKQLQYSIDLETFWLQFDVCVQRVSNEVTKLSLQFSKAPYPEVKDTCTMLNELKACYTQMLAVYYHVAKEVGATLRKELLQAVKKIMYSLFEVIKSLKDLSPKGNQDRMVYTGTLWDACSAVEKLPRDNHQATLIYLEGQRGLVYDALKEIEEEICTDLENLNTPGDHTADNEEIWNNQEREMAGSCTGLLKTACACMKRIQEAVKASGKCDSSNHIKELDTLCQHVSTLSPAVDNFGSEIYPPMNMDSVRSQGALLVKTLSDILEYVKTTHLVEEDSTWVDFLLRAVDHNNNKLQPFHSSTDPVLLLTNLNLKT